MLLEFVLGGPAWTWLVTALVALLTVFSVKHLLLIRSLPPGPFPLPVVGNLLSFRGKDSSPHLRVNEWRKKYGNLLTIWLGSSPTIMICDWDLCRENLVVKRNEYSGRYKRRSIELFLHDSEDVIFGDYGPCWETLRKIMASAIRRYSKSETLPDLVASIVDEVVEIMLKENNAVDIHNYTYLALYNVLASSAFGRQFSINDEEFISLKESNDALNRAFGEGIPSDALPLLRGFYKHRENELARASGVIRSFFEKEYKKHNRTYEKGVVRDFVDAVIAARDEAEEESKDSLKHLTDPNIISLCVDLFSAGTDTSRVTLNWIFLFICNNPEIQKRIHEEIDEKIGSRTPVQADRDSCPYVYAVMTETLRLRPILDISLEHKSTCDSEINGYKIPKDISIMFHISSSHHNGNIWTNPEVFKPERFLDSDGKFTNARKIGYLPFGLGRRSCPGEKLALVDIFLILVRIMQKVDLELEGGPGSANFGIVVEAFVSNPQPYKLIVKKRVNS